jgi:hypothetical protein
MGNKIYRLSYLLIVICFTSIFIISLFKIINGWSFSQANLNYTAGFVKRGFFGTVMLFFENYFKISKTSFFSLFFIILTSLNIFLFFKIVKVIKSYWILLIYLIFNPALLLFSFNDIGGYQRFDSISVLLILLHVFVIQKIHNKNLTLEIYKKFLFIFFLLIFVSILIHEIQIFSIPFHIIVTYHILKNKSDKIISSFIFLSLIMFGIIIMTFFNADQEMMKIIINKVNNYTIFADALGYAAGLNVSQNQFGSYIYEIKTNLFKAYNLRINLFFILLTLIPIFSILYFFKSIKAIPNLLISNNYFYLLAIVPFFSMFVIGDVGRWISLMAFVAFGLLMTNNIVVPKIVNKDNLNLISKIILLILIIFYCLFTRVPHCCDLQKNQINIYGGILNKFSVIGQLILNPGSENDYLNFDKRFPVRKN